MLWISLWGICSVQNNFYFPKEFSSLLSMDLTVFSLISMCLEIFMLFFFIDFNFNFVIIIEYVCMTQIFKKLAKVWLWPQILSLAIKESQPPSRVKRWILVEQPLKKIWHMDGMFCFIAVKGNVD